MITYQVEKYVDCQKELEALYPEHYEELSVTKNFPLDPDHETYIKLDNAGILVLITCREDEGLIGYIIGMMTRNLHYKSCMMATEDIYFLRKMHRAGRTGLNMFKFFEKEVISRGANRIVFTTKIHLDNSKLFEYLKYSFIEKTFSKVI